MFVIVMSNRVVVILSYMNLSEETLQKVDVADQVFMYIFIGEAVIKLMGLGPTGYF